MPGMMSTLFDPGTSDESSATAVAGDGETGVEASPSISITMSEGHQNADGSTSSWSNTTEAGADVDLGAAVTSTIALTSVEDSAG